MAPLLALTAALTALPVVSAHLHPRASIDSDKVIGFNTTVPDGITGEVYRAYQPHLHVVDGCVPFPGVDAAGNTNAGLNPTGPSTGECSSSRGQVYVRAGTKKANSSSSAAAGADGSESESDIYALLYSWYMPKDSPSTELGHRHDWEGVIVFLSDATSTTPENVLAVCPSAHGTWGCSTDGYTLTSSGIGGQAETSPLIEYFSVWPVNHQMGLSKTVGAMQPLVAWEMLPVEARRALQTTDFGSATVPLKDGEFGGNLEAASFG